MKLCVECLSELFDREDVCFECGRKDLISQSEYNRIKAELQSARNRKKDALLQNPRYLAVFKHYDRKENWIQHLDKGAKYKQYQCPNCGRFYNDGTQYCNNCSIKLVQPEDIDEIKNPHTPQYRNAEAAKLKPTIVCPYCKSEDTVKITATQKAINTWVFGVLGTKRFKEWHCNNCKSDF